jgi:CPA1 family monovalent cation:H+ antiporter
VSLFEVLALLVSITALLGYINQRWLRLPTTIGIMIGGLLVSFGLVVLNLLGIASNEWADNIVGKLALDRVLLGGLLSFLLFAGALHVDLSALLKRRWFILLLATVGTVVSTLLIGFAMHYVLGWLGIELPLMFALLFGSLISPTDPVAVLAILKDTNAPEDLSVMVTGESLFNDGVGVVLFTILLGAAYGHHELSFSHGALLFVEEAGGGAAFGALIGYLAYRMLRRIDNYTVEILITLAVVTAGYALASRLHISGPIAMVIAGLLLGNHGRAFAMSNVTREHLDTFWIVVDEVLNAVLFLLIGLEVMLLDLQPLFVLAGAAAIVISLLARFISVGVPIAAIQRRKTRRRYTVRVMTWGGLRGGIAVALALALPPAEHRDLVLVLTYAVVLFSIIVQGLTVEKLVARASAALPAERGVGA